MNSYPGRGPRFFFAVILMAAATAGLPARAAPEWQMLETPRFTIISQQKEKTTREFAEEFNQFVEALHGVITVDERALPPLTIVLFAREKDFRPFQPLRPDGKY
jgi:Skp family chaperone for outer membrane proteins